MSQANELPPWALWPPPLVITPLDAVHGELPDSKPPLPTTWAGVQSAACAEAVRVAVPAAATSAVPASRGGVCYASDPLRMAERPWGSRRTVPGDAANRWTVTVRAGDRREALPTPEAEWKRDSKLR
ncbi:hypothetical protein GCM10025734_78510 [Kitasatospora paranensis]